MQDIWLDTLQYFFTHPWVPAVIGLGIFALGCVITAISFAIQARRERRRPTLYITANGHMYIKHHNDK